MSKLAGIDIGTNSVLYSLFDIRGKKRIEEMYYERHSPRIGSLMAGQKKPVITEAGYAQLRKLLSRNIRHALRNEAAKILIAATNPFRLAKNGNQIKRRLEDDLKCKIAILSPEREAHLSFLAAAGPLRKNQIAVVIDLGGGSTELVAYRGEKRLAFISVPEGAVSLTERFQSDKKVNPDDFEDFEAFLSRYKSKVAALRPYLDSPIKLVGGTSTALGYLKDHDIFRKPKGVTLSREEIQQYVHLLAPLGLSCRRQLLSIDKKRAEIIFAGAFWYLYLFKILGIKKASATPWGLRHGMVLDFLRQGVFPA